MPYLTTRDGTRLHYSDWGDGRPVVLLGAAMADSRMWEFQAPFLAGNGLRCVTYDRRGSGRSDIPWSGYDYDTLAGDLADLLDHLDLRDAVLVGYAVGGGECVRYLSRYGTARVARLAWSPRRRRSCCARRTTPTDWNPGSSTRWNRPSGPTGPPGWRR